MHVGCMMFIVINAIISITIVISMAITMIIIISSSSSSISVMFIIIIITYSDVGLPFVGLLLVLDALSCPPRPDMPRASPALPFHSLRLS